MNKGLNTFPPPHRLSESVLQLKMHSSKTIYVLYRNTKSLWHHMLEKSTNKKHILNITNLVCQNLKKISDLLFALRCKSMDFMNVFCVSLKKIDKLKILNTFLLQFDLSNNHKISHFQVQLIQVFLRCKTHHCVPILSHFKKSYLYCILLVFHQYLNFINN